MKINIIVCLIIQILFCTGLASQELKLSCSSDNLISINNVKFQQGIISLKKVGKVLGAKNYRTKKKGSKRTFSIDYEYYFDKYGLSFSAYSDKKEDTCSQMTIYYGKRRKKKTKNFEGRLFILKEQIFAYTTFDDIYSSEKLESVIDKSIYSDSNNPIKVEIHLRFEGYKIVMFFNRESHVIEKVNVNYIFYD